MAKKKTLVVYFSRTGFTNGVAEKIAVACHADLEAIRIPHNFGNQHGIMAFRNDWENNGYFQSVFQALTHVTPVIEFLTKQIEDYDRIILGTPVWFWNMASPIRTFITRNDLHQKEIALFCTYGGSGSGKVFYDMEQLIGKKSIARMAITDYEILGQQSDTRIANFARELETATNEANAMPITL